MAQELALHIRLGPADEDAEAAQEVQRTDDRARKASQRRIDPRLPAGRQLKTLRVAGHRHRPKLRKDSVEAHSQRASSGL